MTLAPLSDTLGVIIPTKPVCIKSPHHPHVGSGAKSKHARHDRLNPSRMVRAFASDIAEDDRIDRERKARREKRTLRATISKMDDYDGLEDEVVDGLYDMWWREIQRKLGNEPTGAQVQSRDFMYAPQLKEEREYNMRTLERRDDNVIPIHEAKGYVDMMRYCTNLRGARRYA